MKFTYYLDTGIQQSFSNLTFNVAEILTNDSMQYVPHFNKKCLCPKTTAFVLRAVKVIVTYQNIL